MKAYFAILTVPVLLPSALAGRATSSNNLARDLSTDLDNLVNTTLSELNVLLNPIGLLQNLNALEFSLEQLVINGVFDSVDVENILDHLVVDVTKVVDDILPLLNKI